uniref:C2H2-type domain-containing protein n=1 Tax=Mycena chlorophos TaxID=658473 RepID=A0ABQ0LLA7_MYCCL|nr:predicted protein [Mycena chlorophos]
MESCYQHSSNDQRSPNSDHLSIAERAAAAYGFPLANGLFDWLNVDPSARDTSSSQVSIRSYPPEGRDGLGTVDPMEVCDYDAEVVEVREIEQGSPDDENDAECLSVATSNRQSLSGDETAAFDEETEDEADGSDNEDSDYVSESVSSSRTTKAPRKRPSAPRRPTAGSKDTPSRSYSRSSTPTSDCDDSDVPVPRAALDAAISAGAHLPPNAHLIPEKHHYMLLLGCTIIEPERDGGAYRLACHISSSCPQHGTPQRPPDMRRHLGTHFRSELEQPCGGCPLTFSRPDARKRHLRGRPDCQAARTNPVIRRALRAFNAKSEVRAQRACDAKNRKSVKTL